MIAKRMKIMMVISHLMTISETFQSIQVMMSFTKTLSHVLEKSKSKEASRMTTTTLMSTSDYSGRTSPEILEKDWLHIDSSYMREISLSISTRMQGLLDFLRSRVSLVLNFR